jgi:hypothetical protein
MSTTFMRGHRRENIVGGDPKEGHYDLRVRHENLNARTNIRRHDGHRSPIVPGHAMMGTHYQHTLQCTECWNSFPRSEFHNMAVRSEDRARNGCNIRCRTCGHGRQYSHGYVVDDFCVKDDVDASDTDVDMKEISDTETETGNTSEDLYEVERILKCRVDDDGQLKYLVLWAGYPEEEATWEPEDHFTTAKTVQDFWDSI